MSVIANTTVLSNFFQLQQAELLRQLFGEVYLSVEVYQEVREGLDEGYGFYAGIDTMLAPLTSDGWLRLATMDERELHWYAGLPRRLHPGEASSLAIAKQRRWLFLTDDAAARKTAASETILVSGTLGCLVSAVERGLCSQAAAEEYLARLVSLGYRSPVVELSRLMTRT